MKSLVLAALGTLLITQVHAETLWVGNAFVTAVNSQSICATAAAIGDTSRLIFRPAGASIGNGANSSLAYIGSRSDVAISHPGAFGSGVSYSGYSIGSHVTFGSFTGSVSAWSLTPAVISPATAHYTLTGTITNFYDVTGCTVTLQADLERAP